ncbi:hypothetical protein SDC9_201240 [bioreactor metagenome]|uniref:Uncharacterized protein n=1 Tax=bioreactor metagenome TaxID=1076179 RepID=A0A645IR53_9ZZZZ
MSHRLETDGFEFARDIQPLGPFPGVLKTAAHAQSEDALDRQPFVERRVFQRQDAVKDRTESIQVRRRPRFAARNQFGRHKGGGPAQHAFGAFSGFAQTVLRHRVFEVDPGFMAVGVMGGIVAHHPPVHNQDFAVFPEHQVAWF